MTFLQVAAAELFDILAPDNYITLLNNGPLMLVIKPDNYLSIHNNVKLYKERETPAVSAGGLTSMTKIIKSLTQSDQSAFI